MELAELVITSGDVVVSGVAVGDELKLVAEGVGMEVIVSTVKFSVGVGAGVVVVVEGAMVVVVEGAMVVVEGIVVAEGAMVIVSLFSNEPANDPLEDPEPLDGDTVAVGAIVAGSVVILLVDGAAVVSTPPSAIIASKQFT